ncbi:hypothetical protein AGABI1DRAFT_131064 [Agaricus bisporus var. burnettii JB137-S8]|uniref:PH domain-containing protein n=1 Tax=Agaricus bisporus var. burnettii (strain JB137-S8 / ATCC MYA-4627 / FGSC 10392) TaxID=597362 RepID=K5WN70_AGABU|nr:uncharacterized protein AGABI1DRAFT_131064 [Agaricus bisporus var. burnettii JB137-S8]EKM76771.1 hypothetical protein AGABI1DRAFT_131064 [Agaricus bisporus var. burnettii JB137-S8]
MATHDVRSTDNMLTSEHPDDPFHATTAADLNFYLQGLLDKKEKQLQQAGNLGQRVLAQQMELEERIRQIQESVIDKPDDEEIDHAARSKYQELNEAILSWDAENSQLSSAFGSSSKRYANSNQPSPTTAFAELPSEAPEYKRPSGSAAGQSRRAKNAANRSFIDPEFAMDIGNNLLAEIRRLQSLLTERDKAIQDMKEERDDLERTVEALKTALKEQERSSDKYREENWNLEVTLQELRSQLADSQSSAVRLETEHKKLSKSLTQTRDQAELHKTESEKHQAAFNDLKSKHESDVAQARKHAAGLARDKQDLQQTVDTLKLQISRVNRRLPKYGSPLTPGTGDNIKDFITPGTERTDDTGTDIFTGGASTNRRRFDNSLYPDGFGNEFYDPDTPEDSPIRRPFQTPNTEIEALQQRLAHAQRQINTLKGSLNREKQIRIRLENAAAGSHPASQLGSEGEEEEEVEEDETQVEDVAEPSIVSSARGGKPRRGGTAFKVGRGGSGMATRRGRGRGGITLMQRLGLAANSPSASSYNDEGEDFSTSPPTSVPSIPINLHQASPPRTEEEEEENFFNSSTSSHTLQQDGMQSNRTSVASVDGMDPAFANVLKRSSSSSSYSSPLRHSLLSRRGSTRRKGVTAGRRNRGGVPFKEARPPSVINDNPSALAAELGLSPGGESEATAEDGANTSSPMKGLTGGVTSPTRSSFLDVEESIREEEEELRAWRKEVVGEGDEDEDEDEEVEEVEMREFGCQTDPVPDVAKTLVDISVETDSQFSPFATIKGKAWPEGLRRTTITQKDFGSLRSSSSKTISNGDDHTITRSFLRESHTNDDDAYSEGEETETGADDTETEADYYDARTDMNTPSLSGRASALSTSAFTESRESFHSIMTVSDHEYPSDSGSESDESIRASSRPSTGLERRRQGQGQQFGNESKQSLVTRSESVASYYTTSQGPFVSYEDVGVDASVEPEVVVKEVPVEVIKEVEVVKEVRVEVPVEVIREVEVIKEVKVEVPVEVIREVEVIKEVEVVKEVVKEVPVEVIKEVSVEVIKEVEVVREVLKEVPVEVIKEVRVEVPVPVEKDVEIVKEVVKEVLVEVPVPKEVEVVREVRVEVPVEVVKEVIREVEIPVEVIKEVPVEVIREVRVEVPVEVKVPFEVVKEVVKIIEKPVEVIREVEVIKEVPVEVIRDVVRKVPVEVIREIPAPKCEVREMEIQTDDTMEFEQSTIMDLSRKQLSSTSVQVSPISGPVFIPPPPTTAPPPSALSRSVSKSGSLVNGSSPTPLLRTGSQHQFQFIPSNTTTSPTSKSDTAPILLSRASRLSASDRRTSMESGISSLNAGDTSTGSAGNRPQAVLLNAIDKSKPPMMVLPPPPKAPPPPGSMPPPSFIPDRNRPPPRPLSPPPPELIQRATTPTTFGSTLNVPGANNGGTNKNYLGVGGGSMRQLPSTSSFRSAGQYGTVGNQPVERRQVSNASLAYSGGERSPRSSISSSDGHGLQRGASMMSRPAASDGGQGAGSLPVTPNRTPRAAGMTGGAVNGHQQQQQQASGTDPIIIHAITQTMIGEFLWKYTRKAIGKGHGERRHKRFFWVHPYTKTLYWSSSDPGSSNVNESSAKSAYIEGVRSVLDPNPMPPGLYQYSVVVSTPQREMKITAPTKERHDIWLNALKYLLSRPSASVNNMDDSPPTQQSPADYQTDDDPVSPRRRLLSSPQSVRSRSSRRGGTPGDTWSSTPKGKRSRSQLSVKGSVSKRSGTPAAEYLRWNGPESPYSPSRSFIDEARDDDIVGDGHLDLNFELHDDDELSEGGYEGLENVRACCDGRHTVGHSHPKKHSHPQHQQGHAHTAPLLTTLTRHSLESQHQQADSNPMDIGRPASPAWSFRSRTGSADGHSSAAGSGSGGLLSKLRFGSKRGPKNTPVLPPVDQ